MILHTQCTDFQIAATTLLTGTSFASIVPTTTEPTPSATRAIISMAPLSGESSNLLMILPYGTGQSNAVITGTRIYGWDVVRDPSRASLDLWVPVPLLAYDGVMGSAAGVAGGILTASHLFLDTITLTANYAAANIGNEVQSNQNNQLAYIVLDARSYKKIEFDGDLGANATGMGWLVKRY